MLHHGAAAPAYETLLGLSDARRARGAAKRGAAVMPPIDEEYDLLLTEDFGGGGGGGAGFPSHNGDDETLLYPTLASTASTMPKTDTKKAFFLLGLIGAVADLDRRAFFVVVAVTNLYAMRFLKAHVRPALTKWMCCNTRFPVWKSTSRRWRNLVSTQATPRQRHRPHDTHGADDHAARGRHGLGPAEEQEQADDLGVRAGRPLREMARPVRPLTVQTLSKAPPPVPRGLGRAGIVRQYQYNQRSTTRPRTLSLVGRVHLPVEAALSTGGLRWRGRGQQYGLHEALALARAARRRWLHAHAYGRADGFVPRHSTLPATRRALHRAAGRSATNARWIWQLRSVVALRTRP